MFLRKFRKEMFRLLLHSSLIICINFEITVYGKSDLDSDGPCKHECMLWSKCAAYLKFYNIPYQDPLNSSNSPVCCPKENEFKSRIMTSDIFQAHCDSDEDDDNDAELRTYGGRASFINEFSYLALLHYHHPNGDDNFPCSGTLVSDLFILTAAHCVTGAVLDKYGKLVSIRLGEHDLSDTTCKDSRCNNSAVDIGIQTIFVHKDYDEKQKQHDIALVRLEKPIKQFRPACLSWSCERSNGKLEPGHNYTIVGWGRTLTARRATISNTLEIPFYDHEECVRKYARLNFTITDSQICAGGVFKKDTCDGDSGGPLISKVHGCEFVDGIVSFGKGCGLDNWPGIYVNVASYKKWIIEHMKPYNPLPKICNVHFPPVNVNVTII